MRYTESMRKDDHRGFTIIEAVVSVFILSLIALALITFQLSVMRTASTVQANLTAQREVRRALGGFTAELRTAAQSSGGSYAIESAGTSSITFYANIDQDAGIERLRYLLATTTTPGTYVLRRGLVDIGAGTTTYNLATEQLVDIVNAVKNTTTPIFSYYDSNYAGTSSPLSIPVNISSIRHVRMTVVVDPNSARSPIQQYYSTEVTIRNFKNNY